MLTNYGKIIDDEHTHVGIRCEFLKQVVTDTKQTMVIIEGDKIIIDAMNSFVSDFESEEYYLDNFERYERDS